MNKWDKRFMRIAVEVASWSKDPSTKVGAVIAKGKYRVSDGYNGFLSEIKDDDFLLSDRDSRLAFTDHAERNAIDTAREMGTCSLHNCTIYVTSQPCHLCAKAIAKAGIIRVVHLQGTDEFNKRWIKDFAYADVIFQSYGIKVECITRESLFNKRTL